MGILNPAVRASYAKEQILDLVRIANRLYDAIEALPQIVIAAFNGAARAGAAELSLACDIRLAAAHATLRAAGGAVGRLPRRGRAGPAPRARRPRARARAHLHRPRDRRAPRWSGSGSSWPCIPPTALRAEAQALAARIAASGPIATRGAKRIMNAPPSTPASPPPASLSDTLRHALEWSHDVDEGMAAHREGRPPRFTGR